MAISIINKNRIDNFRLKFGESHFVFACQASVPLLFSTELLYNLWLNFNTYTCENRTEKISYLAVSDLILSSLCQPIGSQLFKMDEDVRKHLNSALIELLTTERRTQIAAFLKQFTEKSFTVSEKKIQEIHRFTADAILDPELMQRKLAEAISLSASDYDKLSLLSLYYNFSSESSANDPDYNYINLVATEDPNQAGVLKVPISSTLINKIQNRRPPEAENILLNREVSDVLEIINRCNQSHSTTLDLGNCGLTDNDFEIGREIDKALRKCSQLEVLILSNEWWDIKEEKIAKSSNKRNGNVLSQIPAALNSLTGLSKLICSGEYRYRWSITDVSLLSNLENLTYLDLSNNLITNLSSLEDLKAITFLNISSNNIYDISPLKLITKLKILNLRNNKVSDLSALSKLINLEKLHLQDNEINDITPLEHTHSLKELWCKNNQIEDLTALAKLESLEKVGLWSNNISDLSPLVNLTKLRILNVGTNKIEHLPEEFAVSELPIYYKQREVGSDQPGIFLYDNPLITPPLEIINSGKKTTRDYFKRFRSYFTIKKLANQYSISDKEEFILDALLIFSTTKQQTWIITSNKNIFYFLDDLDTKRDTPFTSSKTTLQLAHINIKAEEIPKKRHGVISIGGKENWLYSLHLFKAPSELIEEVKQKISKALDYNKNFKIRTTESATEHESLDEKFNPNRLQIRVYLLYDFSKDHDNDLRITLTSKLEEYDLVVRSNPPNETLEQTREYLQNSEGAIIFYGDTDAQWFAYRQSLLLDRNAPYPCAICLDEPDIKRKINRDIAKGLEIITKDNLDLKIKQFVERLKVIDKINPKEHLTTKIYFSYAWEDGTETIIDLLSSTLKAKGYQVITDRQKLKFSEPASSFIEEMANQDIVVIALSDKYLRSEFCMYEMYEIYRKAASGGKGLMDHILSIQMDDINISEPKVRYRYIEYWGNLLKEKHDYNADLGILQRVQYITKSLHELLSFIADLNTTTIGQVSNSTLETVIDKIENSVSAAPGNKSSTDKETYSKKTKTKHGETTLHSLGYEYDIYISYAHSSSTSKWISEIFLPLLKTCLIDELGETPRIFIDSENIEISEKLSDTIDRAVKKSKILIPILSLEYLTSRYTLSEFISFYERKYLVTSNNNLIFPIAISDTDILNRYGPSELTNIVYFNFQDYFMVGKAFMESYKYNEMRIKFRQMAKYLVEAISHVPLYNEEWPSLNDQLVQSKVSEILHTNQFLRPPMA